MTARDIIMAAAGASTAKVSPVRKGVYAGDLVNGSLSFVASAGDIVIAFATPDSKEGLLNWGADAGWTRISNNPSESVALYRVQQAGDQSTVTFYYGYGNFRLDWGRGVAVVYGGAAYDTAAQHEYVYSTPVTVTGPTATADNSVLLGFVSRGDTSGDSVTLGSTDLTQLAISTLPNCAQYAGEKPVSAGATSATFTATQSDYVCAILLTLKPA
jgi:hypothetical protein